MAITKEQRKKVENLVYECMATVDKTKINLDYYKVLFAGMSDKQFEDMFKRPFAIRFHQKPFVTKPKYGDIKNALAVMGVPLMESVYEPFEYVNDKGVPLKTRPCLVGYFHVKPMKQILSKKNSNPIEINKRNMTTGRLIGEDKGGLTSDNELNSLITMGLEQTAGEFYNIKGDAMNAKSQAYNNIRTTGILKQSDIDIDPRDSIAKNTVNVSLIGAHIYTNLINEDYMLPITLDNKSVKQIKTL